MLKLVWSETSFAPIHPPSLPPSPPHKCTLRGSRVYTTEADEEGELEKDDILTLFTQDFHHDVTLKRVLVVYLNNIKKECFIHDKECELVEGILRSVV